MPGKAWKQEKGSECCLACLRSTYTASGKLRTRLESLLVLPEQEDGMMRNEH